MVMKSIFVILSALILAQLFNINEALARPKDYSVFAIRKNLPLHDNEPIFRDYYINLGTDEGMRVGQYVAVKRRVPVIDIYRNKAQDDLIVPIAHLKVIHAQKSMCVARLASQVSPEQIPVVQFEQVMLGDRVELVEDLPTRDVAVAPVPAPAPETVAEENLKATPKKESKPVAQGQTDLTTTRN